jgi:hypothetical protein
MRLSNIFLQFKCVRCTHFLLTARATRSGVSKWLTLFDLFHTCKIQIAFEDMEVSPRHQ